MLLKSVLEERFHFTGAEITYEYGSQSTGGNEGSVGSGATYLEGYNALYIDRTNERFTV